MSRVDEMVELIRGRIHSEFDGECHLTDTEAHAVADLLSELDADYLRRHKDATDRFCEVQELRQLLSEAEKRERETLTQLSELAELEAGDLVKKWNSDLGATVETKAAGAASHIVNDFRGHIEAALIKLERRAALERSEG